MAQFPEEKESPVHGLTLVEIDTLKSEHGDLKVEHLGDDDKPYDVVVKAPTHGEWRRFNSESMDQSKRANAVETLVLGCVVYPKRKDFFEALKKRPGYATSCFSSVSELAGVVENTRSEKL